MASSDPSLDHLLTLINQTMKKYIILSSLLFLTFIIGAVVRTSFAGSLTPSVSPASTMYTLEDIYTKLTDSTTTATEGTASFTTPGTVSATLHNLKQIYELIPTIDATKVLCGTTYLGVAGSASAGYTHASAPLKTGQTTCYDVSGNSICCASTGQDGQYQAGVARSYTDNGDGTVTANSTGLMWQKCTVGLSGSTCATGSATSMDLSTSISTCEALSLASHTDWRLPNLLELESIVNPAFESPAIDTTYFPATPSSGAYWSSTGNALFIGHSDVWQVEFGYGGSSLQNKTASTLYARCVRG